MQLLSVGGHCRSVGKTALVEDLIRAFAQAEWTAVKITQYGHNICSANGRHCECAPREACAALEEERDAHGRSDTSRFLAAGARRAFWLRTRQDGLAQALPLLLGVLRGAQHVIIESNSLLEFLDPALYLVCLDPERADFKNSAVRYLDRADAFVLRSRLGSRAWPDVPLLQMERKPRFLQPLGAAMPPGLLSLVASRFDLLEKAA